MSPELQLFYWMIQASLAWPDPIPHVEWGLTTRD